MIFLCLKIKRLRSIGIIITLFLWLDVSAQTDTMPVRDSNAIISDTLQQKDTAVVKDTVPVVQFIPVYRRFDTSLYINHPYFKFDKPVRYLTTKKEWQSKDMFFYLSIGLLLFFAFIRNAFGRYLNDLFKLFFRTTVKQRQVKEQLMQSPLPSLLMNLLFIVSGAVFIHLVFNHYGLGSNIGYWTLLLYIALALALIYLGKFLVLKVCGWIFSMSEATEAYTFIVFTTNKVLGIIWLPFIILLAFSSGTANEWLLTLGLVITGALFLYRFYLSYATLPKNVKLHPFHFLLYLSAFEMVPLLLINKLLFTFLS
jgi:hypothetical protein